MARRVWRTGRRRAPGRPLALAVVALGALLTFNAAVATHPRPPPLPAALVPADPSTTLPSEPGPVLDASLQGLWNPAAWASAASTHIDRVTLGAEGVTVPEGANVFAARVAEGGPSPAYLLYEAGGGAFSTAFYPASSVKVLAAVGVLELLHASGFTGAAVVDGVYHLAEYYDGAIRYSSNEDYDTLVRMAGTTWLNKEFLPAEGYRSTHIQEAYAAGEPVTESPAVHLAEDGRELTLPERHGEADFGCEGANCSTLFDLVDSVRRVTLHEQLPPEERFNLAPADVAGLRNALLGASSWIGEGVVQALGPDAEVYSKPGWTTGRDCVDVALVVDGATSDRYLLGLSTPDDGECAGILATMAAEVLTVVSRHRDGRGVRPDGTAVAVVDGRQRAG